MRIFLCQQCGITFTRKGSHRYQYCSLDCSHAHAMTVTQSTLAASVVRQIRRQYAGKYGEQTQLAREYGLTTRTVWRIVHGVTWDHLT